MSTIIEIDTSSAIEEVIRLEKEIENYKKLSKQIEDENKELVKGMKELAEQGGSNSEQFKQMNQKLIENRKTLVENNAARSVLTNSVKNLNKQMESAYRLQNNENTSLNSMRKSLTDLRVIYDNLEDQESEYAKQVLSDIAEMNEKVKSQEEAQGIYSRNVGDYYRNLSKSTNQVKETTEGANKVTSALASSFSSMGVESKIAESGIKGMTIAQTGLEGATKLLNSVAEAGGVQMAINTALEKLRTKQQERQVAATAAQTAAQTANTLATKAAAVATWLWNAALAANPIILIATGVAALAAGIGILIKKLSDNKKIQDQINQSMKDYEKIGEERQATDKRIATNSEKVAQKLSDLTDDELNNAKLRGASARELQQIQERANVEKLKNEQKTAQQMLASANLELSQKKAVVSSLEKMGKKLSDEQKQQLEDYKKGIKDLAGEIPNLELAVNAFPQALENAETEALLNSREYAKERAKIAKDVEKVIEDTAVNAIENSQKKAIESRKLSAQREIEDIKSNTEYSASQKAKLIKASEARLAQDLANINQTNAQAEFQRQAKAIEDNLRLKIDGQKKLNKSAETLETEAENTRYANLLKANELRKKEEQYSALELENLEKEHQNKLTEISVNAEKDRRNIERLAVENEYFEKETKLMEAMASESELSKLHLKQLNDDKNSLRREDFANEESYKRAILEVDRKIFDEQQNLLKTQASEREAVADAYASTFGALSELTSELGGEMSAFGAFSKGLAMMEIMINSAKAISGAVSGAMTLPYPANLAAVATGIASVTTGIASAKKVLSSAGNVPKYAHGGFVGGNIKSGDKIPIMANSGELILNTEQQKIFEQIGNQNTSIDYELMYSSFSRAIGEMKQPTMVYSEFVEFQKNLAIFDENAKIK